MSLKIIGISGSLRKNSRNSTLLEVVSKLMPSEVDFSIASIDLPLFTDNEEDFPQNVVDLREEVRNADGLFLTTPEYNWNITAALKNAIDWLSLGGAKSPLNNHVCAIAGIGGGRLGSVRAQMATRTTLLHNRVWVIPGPEVLISPSPDLFDEQGNLSDDFATSLLQQNIDELVRVAPVLRKKN